MWKCSEVTGLEFEDCGLKYRDPERRVAVHRLQSSLLSCFSPASTPSYSQGRVSLPAMRLWEYELNQGLEGFGK